MSSIKVIKDNSTQHILINDSFFNVDLSNHNISMVLTDLPYGTTNAKWDNVLDLYTMWEHLNLITKPNTPIVLFAQTPFDKILGCSNINKLKYEWVWEKTSATGHLNAKKMPMKAHENILVFYDKLPIYNPQKTTGHKPANTYTKHTSDGELYGKTKLGISGGKQTDRYPRDVLTYASDKQKINLNPTQKPLDLLRYMVRTYTNVGDLVLDFTAGSMSTSVACYLEGRNSICIELDESQYNKSIQWVTNCSIKDPYKTEGTKQ